MSRFRSVMTKQVLGPGVETEDANPIPKAFRTPHVVEGVQRTTPVEAIPPINSPVSTTRQPQ